MIWTVQPDGRHWMDDDGFGDEDQPAIALYTFIDEAGRFTADKHVHHTHEGSIGCLCTAEIAALMQSAYQRFGFDRVARAEQALLEAAAR